MEGGEQANHGESVAWNSLHARHVPLRAYKCEFIFISKPQPDFVEARLELAAGQFNAHGSGSAG